MTPKKNGKGAGKGKGKGKVSVQGVAALSDLDNGKQTEGIQNKKKENEIKLGKRHHSVDSSVVGSEEQGIATSSNNTRNIKVRFFDDDETVDMEVEDDKFLNEDNAEEREEGEVEDDTTQRDQNYVSEDDEEFDDEEDEEDLEVSFSKKAKRSTAGGSNSNESNSVEQEKKGQDDEDLSQEEEVSMMKFAKFLERKGFLARTPTTPSA